jgi:hypothetical protein
MTYKELLGEALTLPATTTYRPLQAFLENHSPVMKLWFVVMLLNFVMVLCLI